MKDEYFVEVVEVDTNKVVKRMGPMSERKANRVDDGLTINLNHEQFYTRVVKDEADR